ncbi:MAG: hypothetical protein HUU20_15655 [Pirellulales bacterium]|nr:hypothetical protein [Pirellulales bacterium]
MAAEAVTLPADGTITGRRLTLLEALSTANQQRRQAEVAHAYWRLAEAVAEYRYAYEENAVISQFQVRQEDTAMLQTAQSSAAAALRATEVAVVEAQSDLAEAALLPVNTALPLPADPPHVGTYRTHFDTLFAMRPAPARARWFDRTLALRCRAIDLRAAAVHAADNALEAVTDAYRQGQVGLTTVLAAMGQLGRQRRDLIAAVCEYNHDIADYALAVAAPGTSGPALVGMLIRSGNDSRQPAGNHSAGPLPGGPRPAADSQVQPAMHTAPVAEGGGSTQKRPGQPTLAPPRPRATVSSSPEPARLPETLPQDRQVPTLAPPRESLPSSPQSPAAATSSSSASPSASPKPADSPGDLPQDAAGSTPPPPESTSDPSGPRPSTLDPRPSGSQSSTIAPPPSDSRPSGQVAPLSSLPPVTSRTAMRPFTDTSATLPTTALYPALAALTPAVRCKQLAVALHGDQEFPKDATLSITLVELLKTASPGPRQPLLSAYWLARQKAAEYRALGQVLALFDQLEPLVLQRRSDAAGAAAMLQVRACKLAADARRLQTYAELLAAEFQLTSATGRPLEGPWLLPTTPPHSGPYLLKLEAQPQALVATRRMQRLAAVVPALSDGLQQRAAAVVHADTARANAVADYQSGVRAIDDVLISINQQIDQTLAFLETLTAYNDSIAEYALAVLPPTAPAEVVAQTLVVME